MKSSYIGFLIFINLLIIFFIIPDPEGLQKPFRILTAVIFVIIYFARLIKNEIPVKSLIPALISLALLVIMINRGTVQTSFFNASLCLIGVLCLPTILFKVDKIRRTNLIYIHALCLISIIIQFLIFRSTDGRPRLMYEINHSGSYLFLFFLLSDALKIKSGKIAVIVLSLLTLSRLLIFSIVLFYAVRLLKKPLLRLYKYTTARLHEGRQNKIGKKQGHNGTATTLHDGTEEHDSVGRKINVPVIVITSYIIISIFSLWYVANITKKVSYETSVKRLTTLNDGSNQLRFFANTLVMASVYTYPLEGKTLFGYGKVENFIKATKDSLIMPHNELFDSVVQFGIISVLFFSIFTLPVFQKYTTYYNIEFFLPILLYTLILWVRYLLVPSFEMIFILFLLYQTKDGAEADISKDFTTEKQF